MDINFLEILVCPLCKGTLHYRAEQQELVCSADKLVFPIEDGIPMMVVEKAHPLQTEETS